MKTLSRIAVLVFAGLLVSAPAVWAQQGPQINLNIDLSSLEAKADEVVDVTLDGPLLRLAGKFMSADEPDEAAVRSLLNGLTGIYVRSFHFEEDGAYDMKIAEKFRAQVGKEWQRIVSVRSKKAENAEIWVRPAGEKIGGLIIIAAEPDEFTVVNIVGTIDLDQISELDGEFGIPKLGLEKERHGKKD